MVCEPVFFIDLSKVLHYGFDTRNFLTSNAAPVTIIPSGFFALETLWDIVDYIDADDTCITKPRREVSLISRSNKLLNLYTDSIVSSDVMFTK